MMEGVEFGADLMLNEYSLRAAPIRQRYYALLLHVIDVAGTLTSSQAHLFMVKNSQKLSLAAEHYVT
jgi:hypothetical protein